MHQRLIKIPRAEQIPGQSSLCGGNTPVQFSIQARRATYPTQKHRVGAKKKKVCEGCSTHFLLLIKPRLKLTLHLYSAPGPGYGAGFVKNANLAIKKVS